MKNNNKARYIFILPLLAIGLFMTGCYDSTWDSHVANDTYSKYNLAEVIAQKPELSTFYQVLKKTGYDQFLNSANSLTVFAPKNNAWSTIDTTNTDQLVKIVGNLIVYKSYFTDMPDLYKSIKTIKGKNIFYDQATRTFNGASIDTTQNNCNLRTTNGVLQMTDKVVELRNNIWEYLSTKTSSNQYQYINSLNKRTMDISKSIAIGVDKYGKTKYDTVWTNVNNFLQSYPIDNEDSLYTYVIIENDGFNNLYSKYKPYFQMPTAAKTDSATRFNVCQDFVFKGILDITTLQKDTTDVDGVTVPLIGSVIKETYNTSNGRVYVINQSNIRLKDKIKPIKIEGENFTRASDAGYVFTRYKLWASGQRDIAVAGGETQTDTLYRKTTGLRDSIVTKNYYLNSNLVANVANFFVEYKAKVNSCNYDLYYVAYDDNTSDADSTYRNYGVYRVIQKLFISMPGGTPLTLGTFDNTRGVANNYLGDLRCFVGQGMAGKNELTKLRQMNLVATTQLVDYTTPITTPNSDVMTVPNTGTLTMWLCNTARSVTASRQGLLFLDYILLVPRITE